VGIMALREIHDEDRGVYMAFEEADNLSNPYTFDIPAGVWMVTGWSDSHNGRLGYDPGNGNTRNWLQMESSRDNCGGGVGQYKSRFYFDRDIAKPAIFSQNNSYDAGISLVRVDDADDIFITTGDHPSYNYQTIDLPDDDNWMMTGWGPNYYSRLTYEELSNDGWFEMEGRNMNSDRTGEGRPIFNNNGFRPQIQESDGRSEDYYFCARRYEP
jgi:hypothetical protein